MSEFDSVAREWDNQEKHVIRAREVAGKIISVCPLNKKMNALEYGAGTGLLSFLLKNHLGSITLMDNSPEMVNVSKEKIKTTGTKNIKAVNFNLELNDYTDEKFDIIYNLMVMHHVGNIKEILRKFYNLLNKEGIIAIADLYAEDGNFHQGEFNGHHGFDPEKLKNDMQHIGFKNIKHEQCYTIEREQDDGSTKPYPVFLLTGRK